MRSDRIDDCGAESFNSHRVLTAGGGAFRCSSRLERECQTGRE